MASTINAKTTGTGGIEYTADASGEIELQSDGVTKAKVTANGLQDANGNSLRGGSFRNLITNGDMRIDQRNSGASITANNQTFAVDRFKFRTSQSSKMTAEQVTDVPTGQGFQYSTKITSSSAYTVLSTDFFNIQQLLEVQNINHLMFGTSNAKTVTLSFWVKSSLTGSFSVSLNNLGVSPSVYPAEYIINAANTWEKKTITIQGDTSGTYNTTPNSAGLGVIFSLGFGSNSQGTKNSWNSADTNTFSGAVNLVETNGATLYITGVQLEVGEGASDFEFLPYDVKLARCQRYFEKSYSDGTAIGTASVNGRQGVAGAQGQTTTSAVGSYIYFKVQKRTTPTITTYDSAGASGKIDRPAFGAANSTGNTSNVYETNDKGFIGYSSSGTASHCVGVHYTADSEL